MALFRTVVTISLLTYFTNGNEILDDVHFEEAREVKHNTVVIALLVRNKAHILPYFLTCLQKLDYPKDRLLLW